MKILVLLLMLFVVTGCDELPLISSNVTIEITNPYEALIEGHTTPVRRGETVTLTVQAPQESAFLYWLDLDDYRILSTSATWTFEAIQAKHITPVFAPDRVEDDRFQEIILPDFEGFTEDEMIALLETMGLFVESQRRTNITLDQSNQFVMYGQNRNPGDRLSKESFIVIIVSSTLSDNTLLFEIEDIPYAGPRLDLTRITNPEDAFTLINGVARGTGTAFHVEYRPGRRNQGGGCIDGDTSVFLYPEVIYQQITNRTPSTRYFNFDTPETFPGGEEAFGMMATTYVCGLLDQATSIVLQTDPGDNLLDRHGRLLAWVWILLPGEDDYQLLNFRVVRQGLGEVMYLFGAGETNATVYEDKTYTAWMKHAEALAQAEARGLFGTLLDPFWDYDLDAPNRALWP